MSKKLLMAASDEFKGPIVYETVSGTDIQAKPSNDSYSILEDEPLYFEGCTGSIQFNGSSMPTFLGNEVAPGIYEYYILQKSVINPEQTSITSFRINQQLVSWTDTWRDRLYWDDKEGCYMIEKNANFVRVDGTDPSAFKSIDSSFTTIEVDGYPNSMDDYKAPYVRSNWTVASRQNCIDNGWRAIIGYAWTANELVCYMNFGSLQSTETILSVFISNPLNATFPAHNQVANGSLDTSGAIPVEGVRVEKTSLKKKIKLKQYEGGTIYSMVSAEQALKSSVSISIPTIETKYLPKSESFSGVTIKPTIQDLNFIMEGDYVYFKGFSGTHGVTVISGAGTQDQFKGISLLGEYVKENTYRYTINAKSADGTKSKNVTFDIPYQITGVGSDQTTNPVSKMYWSNEAGCYVADLYDKYLRIDSIPETYETWSYNEYTYFGFDTVNGAISYNVGPNTNCNVTTNWYNISLAYQNGTRAVEYKNYETSYIGIAVKNKPDRESLNEYLLTSGYGPAEIIYRLSNIEAVNTGIKKKIKLPWFGEGTIYTMVKTTDYGVTLSPTIEIEVPLKYDFKIAYKIFEGRDIFAKSTNGITIRHDQPGYLVQVRGDNIIYSRPGKEAIVKLLANRLPNGEYEYTLRQTNSKGKETVTLFRMPYMLTWCSINNVDDSNNPRPESPYESPVQQDIFYWDSTAQCYKVEERTGYYFADSAYADIDFVPYVYKSYNIGEGAWEFCVEGRANYNITASQMPRIYSNYDQSSLQHVYNDDHSKGVVFPVLGGSSITTSSEGVMGIYTTASTYDALDTFLKNNPFHLVTMPYWGYTNAYLDFPTRITNIKKPIKFKITADDAANGATYSVANQDLSAQIKIALPVTYLDVDVPEPDYDLGSPKDFLSGSNTYVNTDITLFDTAKDFTILLDYQHYCSGGTYLVDEGVILHCRHENAGTSYKRCGLAVETGTAPAAYVRGATDYNSSGNILGNPYTLNIYQSKDVDNPQNITLYRYRIVIVYKSGIPHRIIQIDNNRILYDYPFVSQIPDFRAHTRPLYLGCQNSTSNSRSKYFKGRINECKVWNGVALDDDQIMRAIGDGPYPVPKYELISHNINSDSTLIRTDLVLQESLRDCSVLLNFEANSNNTSENTAYVASYGHTDGLIHFAVIYDKTLNGYVLKVRGTNALVNDALLPVTNGKCKLLMNFKQSKLNEVYDLSGEIPITLPIKDDLPNPSSTTFVFTLGYLPNTGDTATTRKPLHVWYGDIYNCMVWYDRTISSFEIEYLMKYVLK